MAYFDSPKNKAMWDKELSKLKEEKTRRQEDPSRALHKDEKVVRETMKEKERENNPNRERTSFDKLMKEEAEASRKPRTSRGISKERSIENTMDKSVDMGMGER